VLWPFSFIQLSSVLILRFFCTNMISIFFYCFSRPIRIFLPFCWSIAPIFSNYTLPFSLSSLLSGSFDLIYSVLHSDFTSSCQAGRFFPMIGAFGPFFFPVTPLPTFFIYDHKSPSYPGSLPPFWRYIFIYLRVSSFKKPPVSSSYPF